MPTPSIQDMLKMAGRLRQKSAFVPSQPTTASAAGDPSMGGAPPGMDPAAAGGMPPGAPPGGDPAMAAMPPGADPSMGGMPPGGGDPSMGGAPPDGSGMMAPDGSSPNPVSPGGAGGSGGGSGGGVKIKPEDIVTMQQQLARVLAEMKMQRDLMLDLFKQMNFNISPDTLRSSASSMGEIVDPQSAIQAGAGV